MRVLRTIEIGELESREFLGDELWRKWKIHYDELMGFRKTLKGKPTDEQRVELTANAHFIEFYGTVLFHGPILSRRKLCACTRCGQIRGKI